MNQSLSAFLLFGVLLSLPLTVGGQETNSIMREESFSTGHHSSRRTRRKAHG
jgi:hypothetical protein